MQTVVFAKTFYERSGWISILLSFWRWWSFLAVNFTAVSGIARAVVDAGGINLTGIVRVDPVKAAVNATGCFVTLGVANLALVLVAGIHGAPPVRTPAFGRRVLRTGCTGLNAAKAAYALAWAGGLVVLYFSKALLGVELFGTPAWFAVVGAKAVCVLLAETRVDACCGRGGRWLRRTFLHLERVYVTTPNAGSPDSILGIRHMRQPLSRVAVYTALWAAMLLVKLVFDAHIMTQQWRLIRTLSETAARGKPLAPIWDLSLLGVDHAFLVFGSWA